MALAVLGLVVPLAGCGGGGGGSEPPEPAVRAGQFDVAFGNAGLFELSTAAFANTQTRANSVAVDTAGRLLLAGWTAPLSAVSPAEALVVRLLSTGTLDASFASTGTLLAPFGDSRPSDGRWAFPVAGGGVIFVQATPAACAKIVLPPPPPACNQPLPNQVDVLRLMPNGARDGAWGTTGFGPMVESESRQQADGAVVILTFFSGAGTGVSLRRIDASGRPDSAFGEKADVALRCAELSETSFHLATMAALAIGKFLVARKNTSSSPGNPIRTCITRLNADGTLDSTYGAGGHTYLDGEPQMGASLVALLARNDGGVALVMSDNVFGRARFGSIAWLTPDGAVDTSRGVAGLTSPIPLGAVTAAAMQPDGKILLGGWPYDAASPNLGSPFFYDRPRLLRLDPAGHPDRTFGGAAGDGVAPLVVAGRFLHPMHIAFGADGSIFAAGLTGANALTGNGEASRLAVGKLTGVAR